jgi:exodeoxyribonuclease VII small subunit
MSETTFKEAWGVLQKHAQTLRNQTEPNIDDLLNIVTESVQAYKVCQSRVEAVEKALEEALKGSGTERPAESATVKTTATPVDESDDDVPF